MYVDAYDGLGVKCFYCAIIRDTEGTGARVIFHTFAIFNDTQTMNK